MSAARSVWLACAAAFAVVACGGAGPDQPRLRPSRDVDVSYALDTGGGAVLQERLRWNVATQELRVDPPTTGLYVIIDLRAKRMRMVRGADRSVIEAAAPAGATGLADNVPAGAVRGADDRVAGLACTEWTLPDATGEPIAACLTDDGVLLRARAPVRTLLTATSVQYGPADPAAFQVPADYTRHAAVPR